MTADRSQLLPWLKQRLPAMQQLLAEAVLLESPSASREAQEPLLDLFDRALAGVGYTSQRIPGVLFGDQLVACPSDPCSDQPHQLLIGHCDTVWPLGTLRQMQLEERNGRLYGPGAYDMKAGLVQAVFALGALAELGLEPRVPPMLFINSDEEVGSPESTRQIVRLAESADRVLVLEPALGPAGRIKTRRKGVGRFEIRVLGRAAHAGLEPERGASAILELSLLVPQLFALNDVERGISVNVGTIDGGLRPNVVAPESSAIVDVRVPTPEDAIEIEGAIRRLGATTPGTRLEVTGGINREPMVKTGGGAELWRRVRRLGSELGLDLEEGTAGGASDGNTTYAIAPTIDGMGAVGGGAHAADEHVELEQMPLRAALLAHMLLEPPLTA